MSRRILFSLVLALVLTLCTGVAMAEPDVWDGTKASSFAGGTGSENDPYQIQTAEQLAHIADTTGKCFVLMADIDLNNIEWTPLSGVAGFNGNNKTIYNLKIYQPENNNIGFFSGIGSVTNLKFHNADVTGGTCTAVVSGRTGGYSDLFKNIKVTGLIKVSSTGAKDSKSYARAAVIAGGWAYGSYVNCVVIGDDGSYVRYTGNGDGRYCAGIVGHADGVSKYENCWVENLEIGGNDSWLCGGLTGPGPSSAEVIGCTVKDVTVNATASGGLFGWYYGSTGIVEDCVVENLSMTKTSGCGVFGGYNDSLSGIDLSSNYSIGNPDNLANQSQNSAGKTAAVAITVNNGEDSYTPKRKVFDTIEEAVEALGNEGGEITIFDDQVVTDKLPANITIDAKNDAVIIVPPADGYIMTYPGSNAPHTGVTFGGSNLGFRSQVPLFFNDESTFVGVRIYKDGKLLEKQPVQDVDYTVTEGSTVVTLNANYLKTLESGTYTIAIASNLDGKDIVVDSTFTIPAPALNVPQTGDESNIVLWLTLMTISALAFVAFGRKSRVN